MSRFLRAARHRVLIGVCLNTNGTTTKTVLPICRVRGHMEVPVEFYNAPATLYFEHWNRKAGLNWTATTLFERPGFYIYGPAVVMVRTESRSGKKLSRWNRL